MPKLFASLAYSVWLGALLFAGPVLGAPQPLLQAHAHNDYEHARPLFDALEYGFCSVEADIYLVEGRLLVAHGREEVTKERTLQTLYLDPLAALAKANHGRIYPEGPGFTLLIDIKSDAEETYVVLRNVLKDYSDMLTAFRPDATESRAVTVILSGNRPRQTVAAEPVRYVSIDGRLSDLDGGASVHLIPLISDNWTSHFTWRGVGPIPAEEKVKLGQIVAKTHQQGRRLRFWAIPDTRAVWRELYANEVDLINTDSLPGLQRFLRQQTGRGKKR